MVGITQIINRRSLLQLNYTLGSANGYLSDPYKVVAVLDDATGSPFNLDSYYADKRPSNRASNILFANYLLNVNGDVLNLSYRYFSDSWKVRSHTYDVKYSFRFEHEKELQFHFRFYDQTSASFYHYAFVDGSQSSIAKDRDIIDAQAANALRIDDLVDYASADRRLANINTYTIGLLYNWRGSYKDTKFTARVDHFRQSDKDKRLLELRGWIMQFAARLRF